MKTIKVYLEDDYGIQFEWKFDMKDPIHSAADVLLINNRLYIRTEPGSDAYYELFLDDINADILSFELECENIVRFKDIIKHNVMDCVNVIASNNYNKIVNFDDIDDEPTLEPIVVEDILKDLTDNAVCIMKDDFDLANMLSFII